MFNSKYKHLQKTFNPKVRTYNLSSDKCPKFGILELSKENPEFVDAVGMEQIKNHYSKA